MFSTNEPGYVFAGLMWADHNSDSNIVSAKSSEAGGTLYIMFRNLSNSVANNVKVTACMLFIRSDCIAQ